MSDPEIFVNAVEKGTPKAIVILFGWLGAQPRHLEKYAKLYQDMNCSTIHLVADVLPIMLRQKEPLRKLATLAAKEALKLLKASSSDEDIPLVIHSFSNGGCFVLEQFHEMISEAKTEARTRKLHDLLTKGKEEAEAENKSDWVLLEEALQRGGEIFDSCPAYLSLPKAYKAIELAFSVKALRILISIVYTLVVVFQIIISCVRGTPREPEIFWSHWETCTIVNREAYIYSTSDEATDYEKLHELIAKRKQRSGAKVFVKRLANSKHCQHLVTHRQEYTTCMTQFFDSIKEEQQEQKILAEDPDMTDYQMEMD